MSKLNLSFERLLILGLIGHLMYSGSSMSVAALVAVIALDALKSTLASKQETKNLSDRIQKIESSITSVEKTTFDRLSTMENKLSAMGLSRRNV